MLTYELIKDHMSLEAAREVFIKNLVAMRLHPEHTRIWIARLRDPSRKQISGRLRDNRGMCCLGELCDVSGLGEWKGVSLDQYHIPGGDGAGTHTHPNEVARWLGHTGAIATDPIVIAATFNDEFHCTFPQIADMVEEALRRQETR